MNLNINLQMPGHFSQLLTHSFNMVANRNLQCHHVNWILFSPLAKAGREVHNRYIQSCETVCNSMYNTRFIRTADGHYMVRLRWCVVCLVISDRLGLNAQTRPLLQIRKDGFQFTKLGTFRQRYDQHHGKAATQRSHGRIVNIGIYIQQRFGNVADNTRPVVSRYR